MSGIPKTVKKPGPCQHKTWQKNPMCRGGGGGGNLLYVLCLISNTLSQLEPSSLHPSTVLHHRHLLQTTCYNHLLLLLHLLVSRKENTSSNMLGTRRAFGALQPTTEYELKQNKCLLHHKTY